jgi:hypothetical protein
MQTSGGRNKMSGIIDFNRKDGPNYERNEQYIPSHTQESIENYLIRGYNPGGFVTAILTGDLFRAVAVADVANRHAIWHITKWITLYAPPGSWGSADTVRAWEEDRDQRRSTWSIAKQKNFVWTTLSKGGPAAND